MPLFEVEVSQTIIVWADDLERAENVARGVDLRDDGGSPYYRPSPIGLKTAAAKFPHCLPWGRADDKTFSDLAKEDEGC